MGKLLENTDELTGTSDKHLQNQTKTPPTNFAQKSNSSVYWNLNSSLFPIPERLPKAHCFLQPRQTCTATTCQKREHALGNMTEHSYILLLLITQSPVIVLVSVLKLGVKDSAYSACKLFQVTLVHIPQYVKSQADFSLFGCRGTQNCWVTWSEEGRVSPSHAEKKKEGGSGEPECILSLPSKCH